MNRILCSTGAMIGKPNGRIFRLLEECAKKIDCDGFEFMMYKDWYEKIDEVAEFLTGTVSKPFPAFHTEKGVGECVSRNEPGDTENALEMFEKNCELAKKIGSGLLVLHLWNGEYSDRNFPHNAEVYADLRRISDRYGLTLTVENVVCNNVDPLTHLKELTERYPDISFTYDTKMAEFHGQLGNIFQNENRDVLDHVIHMHINDYKGGIKDWSCLKTLHIGDGQIDFEKFFSSLWTRTEDGPGFYYKGDFTIEATSFDQNGVIDFERMNRNIATVSEFVRKYR